MRLEILSLLLFLTVSSLLVKMRLSLMKPFEKSLNSKGEENCAVGSPSLVVAFESLMSLPPDSDCCVAPGARCAWQCGQDASCTNYNYRTDPKRCDFFYYTPVQCKVVPGCSHAEVRGLGSCQAKDETTTKTTTALITTLKLRTTTKLMTTTTTTHLITTIQMTTKASTPRTPPTPPPLLQALQGCDLTLGVPNLVAQMNPGSGLDETWNSYKYGFSTPSGGYWHGNEPLYRMTNSGTRWGLCFEGQDVFITPWLVTYQTFIMDSESVGYTYFTNGVMGGADVFGATNRKYKFTTKDRNNQGCCCSNMAVPAKGAWFYSCAPILTSATVVLNGIGPEGFYWSAPLSPHVMFQFGRIKLRQN